MKPKKKDNPLLITGQDSNFKITETNVITASIYDTLGQLNIIYDCSQEQKFILLSYGRLMSPSKVVKIDLDDFINKFELKDNPLPF